MAKDTYCTIVSVQLIFNHFLGGPMLAFISCWADATQGQTHHKSLTLIECQLDTKVRLVRWLAFQTCQLKDPGSMPAKRIRQKTDFNRLLGAARLVV